MTYEEKIVDALTGEITLREFTADEIAKIENDKIQMADVLARITEAESAKQSAFAKLEALGLTADDLKALGL